MDRLLILFSVSILIGSLCPFKGQAQGAGSVAGDFFFFFKLTADTIESLQLRKRDFHLLLS